MADRQTFGIVAVLALSIAAATANLTGTQTPAGPPRTLIIEGSKNSEMFPEWYVWEAVLKYFGTYAAEDEIVKEFRFDKKDARLLATEVKAYKEHEKTITNQLNTEVERLRGLGKSRDEMRELTFKGVELERRYKILDARGRILALMTPDDVLVLQAFIQKKLMPAHTVHLSGTNMDRFKLPW